MSEALLAVDDIHVFYGNIQALKGVSLTVAAGEVVTLIGSNGAGKTTTLRAIVGLNKPRSGRITLEGERIDGKPVHEIVALRCVSVARGPARLPADVGAREPRDGCVLSRVAADLSEDFDRVYELFPILTERRSRQAGARCPAVSSRCSRSGAR